MKITEKKDTDLLQKIEQMIIKNKHFITNVELPGHRTGGTVIIAKLQTRINSFSL